MSVSQESKCEESSLGPGMATWSPPSKFTTAVTVWGTRNTISLKVEMEQKPRQDYDNRGVNTAHIPDNKQEVLRMPSALNMQKFAPTDERCHHHDNTQHEIYRYRNFPCMMRISWKRAVIDEISARKCSSSHVNTVWRTTRAHSDPSAVHRIRDTR
jgi:hypothetical protein